MVAHAQAENGVTVLRVVVGYALDLSFELDHQDRRDDLVIFFIRQPPLLFYVSYLSVDDGQSRRDVKQFVFRDDEGILHEGHHVGRLAGFEGAAP
ncbi:hypothetical protein SDC9_124569 [bioreactor metagenome]|uniref:Uncharacterized protein n=1 Tax=bioreactor metagenome TaxID=1076179 RepID=A0A645CKV5_9ZZZZ